MVGQLNQLSEHDPRPGKLLDLIDVTSLKEIGIQMPTVTGVGWQGYANKEVVYTFALPCELGWWALDSVTKRGLSQREMTLQVLLQVLSNNVAALIFSEISQSSHNHDA